VDHIDVLVDHIDEGARLGAGDLDTVKVAEEAAGNLLSG